MNEIEKAIEDVIRSYERFGILAARTSPAARQVGEEACAQKKALIAQIRAELAAAYNHGVNDGSLAEEARTPRKV